MKIEFVLIVIAFIVVVATCGFAATRGGKYPGAVNKLHINSKKIKEYNRLAKRIGFDMATRYSYSDYADIKRKNNVGAPGNYEFLLLSTGGDPWGRDYESNQRFNKQPCVWEMNYYKNHDLTVIHEICHDSDRVHSWVRILKIGEGRRLKLNTE